LMIINKSGIIIRIAISELRTMGRATQGVRLITLKGNDEIASVAKIEHDEDEVKELDENAEGIVADEESTDVADEDSTDDTEGTEGEDTKPTTDDTTE